jgi:hypothetical protein
MNIVHILQTISLRPGSVRIRSKSRYWDAVLEVFLVDNQLKWFCRLLFVVKFDFAYNVRFSFISIVIIVISVDSEKQTD